ncbi:MAG TPA: hypothetical protein VFL86_05125 [Burkholderiaceae bacterium]|nr:hypothetical protein [Burkholderiaceae bacterium]
MPTSSSGRDGMAARAWRLLASPANWGGLALASVALVLKAMGLLGGLGLGVALLGYAAGFVVGGLWLGWPRLAPPAWEKLEFSDEGDAREAMERALEGVRRLTEYNPERRIPASLQARVLQLCQALDALLQQWERSRGTLTLQDSFDARHIAISYLPDALNTYLSIPAAYATSRVLENGKTAQDTFKDTLEELEAKVRELGDDLAAQDAHAFLVHSRFLQQKFGAAPGLSDLPEQAPPPVLARPLDKP